MTRAFIFPGQGSQDVGMGRDLAQNFRAAKDVFDEVDAALGEKLSAIMWDGPKEAITLRQNALICRSSSRARRPGTEPRGRSDHAPKPHASRVATREPSG
jgi:malonyl CoA-acyl carrier protein transacylase